MISSLLAGVDWSDSKWGVHEGDGFSIEFSMGKGGTIEDLMLHVRGDSDAIAAIALFARPLG